ncbi:hypothetical protein M422DRAFT_267709 [Sphaerobolus stellatus SS14]|uniref:Uncharacterized protein n=1 Tax=Sphaerobolus stellatus (strain SS14) TaxID=990650 RepID=A0A0C9TLB6_SPHS4|nr:hypothetical protein M422DRAFT_267709 [Sphaerobolus stellatus SS14]
MPGGRHKKYLTAEEAHEARKESKRKYYASHAVQERQKARIRARRNSAKPSNVKSHGSEDSHLPLGSHPVIYRRNITSKYMTIELTTDLNDALDEVVKHCWIKSDAEEWKAYLEEINKALIQCAKNHDWDAYQPRSSGLVEVLGDWKARITSIKNQASIQYKGKRLQTIQQRC